MRLLHLTIVALLALLVACSSRGHEPRPFPRVPGGAPAGPDRPTPGRGATAPSVVALSVVEQATALLGTPYRPGGTTPRGFDCSGLVQYVYGRAGVPVPRTVQDLYRDTMRVDSGDIRPGDLVFFRTSGRRVSHVGIVRDEQTFIHAPTSRGVVRVEHLGAGYWTARFAGARRVPHAARVTAAGDTDGIAPESRREPTAENERSARSASE